MALIEKLGWQLIHDDSSLWARVLRKKYIVGDVRDNSWLVVKSSWSSTYLSRMTGLRKVVIPDTKWVIGDGGQVRFWKDE